MAITINTVLTLLLRDHPGFFSALNAAENSFSMNTTLLAIISIAAGFYGLVMGMHRDPRQAASSALKVPLLLLASLTICFPLLCVVTLLLGIALPLGKLLAMFLFALAVAALLMAACATIALFFIITGSGYDFMKLLHVSVFALGGAWGMSALWLNVVVRGTGLGGLSGSLSSVVILIWVALYLKTIKEIDAHDNR